MLLGLMRVVYPIQIRFIYFTIHLVCIKCILHNEKKMVQKEKTWNSM